MTEPCCEHCPVANGSPCLGATQPGHYPDFCRWAASGNEVERRTIVNRSRIAEDEPFGNYVAVAVAAPTPALPPVSPLASIPLAGDVVEAIAKRIGADNLAKWWTKKTGLPCGCARRKELMNEATGTLLKWMGMAPANVPVAHEQLSP